MGCKELVSQMLDDDRSYSQYRFRLVASQLHVLRGCHPLHIPRSLDEFPVTVDWTSERALQDILTRCGNLPTFSCNVFWYLPAPFLLRSSQSSLRLISTQELRQEIEAPIITTLI